MTRPMECSESHEVMTLYRLCETFHSLPVAGGLLDQDAVLIHLFSIITSLQNEKEAQRKGRG